MSSDSILLAPGAWPGGGLRLYSESSGPEDGPAHEPPGQLSPDMRVSEFFRGYVLPVVAKACGWSKSTIASNAEGVAFWTALTNDLPLYAIDELEGAEFVAGLRLQPGRADEFLSTASVRKHCFTAQRILGIAGPRERRTKKDLSRFGAELISRVPWIEAPDADDALPDGDFTHEEILAILGACQFMTRPKLKGVAASVWWTALVTFLCQTGLRIGTTMALEWSMIARQQLLIPGAICKRKKPHVQWLHPAVAEAIEPLRHLSKRVFPWANYPRPGAVRWLQRQREMLLIRAGLPAHRQFGFHGFRKYHATELFDGSGLEVAAMSLNHGDSATTSGSYVNGRRQIDARLKQQQAAIERMRLFAKPADR